MKQFLIDITRARASEKGSAWFEKALETASSPSVNKNQLLTDYTGASRRLGKVAVQLEPKEKARLESLTPGLSLDHWGLDEVGRAALLLSLSHLPDVEYAELVTECYRQGDAREQQSWLRGLSLLPDCGRFLEEAVDACRVNVVPLFEAIACENPYPAHYFPEANLNQMVLKALFNGVAIGRILGLKRRFNTELSRMADDYVSEREAAGREVPNDIWLALAPCANGQALVRTAKYLNHENPDHRYWAAVGLGHTEQGGCRKLLLARQGIETEARVLEAIETSLARMADQELGKRARA